MHHRGANRCATPLCRTIRSLLLGIDGTRARAAWERSTLTKNWLGCALARTAALWLGRVIAKTAALRAARARWALLRLHLRTLRRFTCRLLALCAYFWWSHLHSHVGRIKSHCALPCKRVIVLARMMARLARMPRLARMTRFAHYNSDLTNTNALPFLARQ